MKFVSFGVSFKPIESMSAELAVSALLVSDISTCSEEVSQAFRFDHGLSFVPIAIIEVDSVYHFFRHFENSSAVINYFVSPGLK